MNFIKKIPGKKIFVNEARTAFSGKHSLDCPHEIARHIVRMRFSIVSVEITSVYMRNANLGLSLRDLDTNIVYNIPGGDIDYVISIIDNAIINGSTPIACFKMLGNGKLTVIEEDEE